MATLINANPVVYETEHRHKHKHRRTDSAVDAEFDDSVQDAIDASEIFELIRNINDPEHPLTLEQLNVAQESLISVSTETNSIMVRFTPTIPHCSMATLIGLCIRVRLLRSLPARFKVDIKVTEGTHQSEHAVNKQLNDKERVAAALENKHLLEVVNQASPLCLKKAIDMAAESQ